MPQQAPRVDQGQEARQVQDFQIGPEKEQGVVMAEYKITNESKAEAKKVFKQVMDAGSVGSSAFAMALDVLCVPVEDHAQDGWVEYLDPGAKNSLLFSFRKGKYRLWSWKTSTYWYLYDDDKPRGSAFIAKNPGLHSHSIQAAQAWANAEIEKYEAQLATAAVGEALAANKISPAQKEWAWEFCRNDRLAFLDFVARAPVVEKRSKCRHCGNDIYLKKGKVWVHDDTSSIFCVIDGDGVSLASPPDPSISKPFGPGTRLRLTNGDELFVIHAGGYYLYAVNMTQRKLWPNTHPWANAKMLKDALERVGATIIE